MCGRQTEVMQYGLYVLLPEISSTYSLLAQSCCVCRCSASRWSWTTLFELEDMVKVAKTNGKSPTNFWWQLDFKAYRIQNKRICFCFCNDFTSQCHSSRSSAFNGLKSSLLLFIDVKCHTKVKTCWFLTSMDWLRYRAHRASCTIFVRVSERLCGERLMDC